MEDIHNGEVEIAEGMLKYRDWKKCPEEIRNMKAKV